MLIARYNVLESIYQQWSGMSLDEEYESSIIALCKLILQYLAEVLDLGASGQSGPNSFQDQSENNSDMDGIVNKSTKRSFESCSDDIAEATGDQAPVLSHSTSFPRTPKSPFFKRVRTSESPTKSHNRGC